MGVTYAYAADIVKSERDEYGDLIVYGKATGPELDLDGQICDPTWLKSAMPEWFTFGNIREMHQPIAAGIGIELAEGDDGWYLKSKCIDPNTARKIEAKVLKGYSIGIKDPKVIKDADAPGGRITGGKIVETSYVDRPCNPTAKMAIAKLAKDGGRLEAVEAPAEPSAQAAATEGTVSGGADVDAAKDDNGALSAEGTAAVIATDPEEGAPEAAAESADKALARGVGRTILAGLKSLKSSGKLLTKAAPDEDIASAEACMSAIGALIGQEAQGLVDGMQCEAYQIECLLRAYNALQYFCALESAEPTGEAEPTMEVIVLDAAPDITKQAPKLDVKATETAPAKDSGSTEVSELKEQLKAVQAQLAKVLDRPVPGGPVLARPAGEIDKADGRAALVSKAAHYESLAMSMAANDPKAAQGYRELAAAARSGL